ncbi:MAG: TonB-dependent receptor [Pseudomonadota bacterium]
MASFTIHPLKIASIAVALLTANGGQAHNNPSDSENADVELAEVVVYGRARSLIGEASTASEGVVGYDDIRLPPLMRVGELVEAVPGMIATQHSGTGKANQYFVRGFNLDHGTDFSVRVDGVPINFGTHGHGQGYLDLNFIIPELIETAEYHRGPYAADFGDFSSAASVDFNRRSRFESPTVGVSLGEYDYQRVFAAGSAETAGGVWTGALALTRYDGPWTQPEDLEQNKFHAAWSRDDDGRRFSVAADFYESSWDSTDQIPRRAVASGLVDRLGTLDDDLGGNTRRAGLTANAAFRDFDATVYFVDYDFSLFSNFTYFLEQPDTGDEFEQVDERRVYGARIESRSLDIDFDRGWPSLAFRLGADLRMDDIDNVGLFLTEDRRRNGSVREDAVELWQQSLWIDSRVDLPKNWRLQSGLRVDRLSWDVRALRSANSGTGNTSQLSPSLSVAWQFVEAAEFYASWGRGFHSNDVRGATLQIDPGSGEPASPVDAIAASEGAELGLRFEPNPAFKAAIVLFQIDLDSELVFTGDAGTTEPNAATSRHGVEAEVFWQFNEWLAVNATASQVDARFRQVADDSREIPGAIEETLALGLNAAWENGLFAAVRFRWLGGAPLIEDNSVRMEASSLLNVGLGYRRGNAEYRLDAFNLSDSDDADIAYFYSSRLPGEPSAGVADVHSHPLEPRSLRLSFNYIWR